MTETLFEDPPSAFGGPFTLREINRTTAANWCERLDYTGSPGSPGHLRYGGFFGQDMACLVTVGTAGNKDGIEKKYDLTAWKGNLVVGRIVPDPTAPGDAVLRSLNAVAAIYRARGYVWLYTYTDPRWDDSIEDTLSAVGMLYVGDVKESFGWLLDGVPTSNRTVVGKFEGQAKDNVVEVAAAYGHKLVRKKGLNTIKHTYVWPLSERTAILTHLDARRKDA